MKVLVCDDRPDQAQQLAEVISDTAAIPASCLAGEELTEELKKLFRRVATTIKDPAAATTANDRLAFDGVDLLVIDNNLSYLGVEGARLTAESIAGYLRAFTTTSYIVSLNKNPDVDFDLRYLVGDYATKADLAINSNHLDVHALWSRVEDQQTAFAAWYWPALNEMPARRQQQIEFITENLERSVVKTLGFGDDDVGFLSLHAKGALSPDAEPDGGVSNAFEEVTYRQVFLARDRSLPSKEERELLSDAGQNSAYFKGIIARVVAADIDLWIRRDVLGPQEPLIDVPHLLIRFPILLGNRSGNLDEWNRCITATVPPYGLDETLYRECLAPAKFGQSCWTPSPTFWWPKVQGDQRLNHELYKIKERAWPDVVFCEDASRFRLRTASENGRSPIQFKAEFEGSWSRRYIANLKDIQYSPRSRLSL